MFTILLLLSTLILTGPSAAALSTKAELFGVVSDPSGLPVQGAQVDLRNTGTDVKATALSGMDGGYHFFAAPAGAYRITIAKPGFSTFQRDGVAVLVGDRIGLDFTLPVGDVSQSVEVPAAAFRGSRFPPE